MKYIVTGRVHPERADISFSRVQLELSNGGTATANCDASQITVTIDIPSLDGWISAMIVADDIANIIVGALGFSLGSGYSVELIQVTEEDGTPHVFGVRPEGKKAGETLAIEPYVDIFNRAFRLAGRNIFFRLALRDYLQAITDVTDCATYCYRAVESIKAAFVQKTGMDQWDDMHAALGTDRSAITSTIKQFADPIRHGNWVNAKPTDKYMRWDMLELTRNILIKYLNYEEPAI
jgi:hypothetical protein